jgi:hypothetical protein
MQTLEQANPGAADLYWLAHLITGSRETSVKVAVEALESQNAGNAFFSAWMPGWSRRVVIARALRAIRDELATSGRRTAWRARTAQVPSRNWSMDHSTTKVQVEHALLAIDVFPRVALLLAFFGRVALEDAAILLDESSELVRKARTIGLRELTRNLALMQGWTSTAINSFAAPAEVQLV